MAVLLALALFAAMVVRGVGLAFAFAYIARRNGFSTGGSLGYGAVGGLLSVFPLFVLPMSIVPIVIRRRAKHSLSPLTTIDSYVDVLVVALLVLFALSVLMVFLPQQIGPVLSATSGVRTVVGLLAVGFIIRSLFLGRGSAKADAPEDEVGEPGSPSRTP